MKRLSFILICLILSFCFVGCIEYDDDFKDYEEELRSERNESADPEVDGYELEDGTIVYFDGEKEDYVPLQ